MGVWVSVGVHTTTYIRTLGSGYGLPKKLKKFK